MYPLPLFRSFSRCFASFSLNLPNEFFFQYGTNSSLSNITLQFACTSGSQLAKTLFCSPLLLFALHRLFLDRAATYCIQWVNYTRLEDVAMSNFDSVTNSTHWCAVTPVCRHPAIHLCIAISTMWVFKWLAWSTITPVFHCNLCSVWGVEINWPWR